MPVDQSLVGREFPPTAPLEVTEERVAAFAASLGAPYDASGRRRPADVPHRPRLRRDAGLPRPPRRSTCSGSCTASSGSPTSGRSRLGDVLTATLSVVSLRQIGGADIIGTSSAITDADGALVCTGRATLVHSGGAPSGQQETA